MKGILPCKAPVVLLAVALAGSAWAPAADLIWNNPSGGSWNVATSGSPNVVPGPADRAVITNGGSYIVQLNASATVATLILGGHSGVQQLTNSTAADILTLTGDSQVGTNGLLGPLAGKQNAS